MSAPEQQQSAVRCVRLLARLDVKQFGQRIGVRPMTAVWLDKGELEPTVHQAIAISRAFGVSIEHLIPPAILDEMHQDEERAL